MNNVTVTARCQVHTSVSSTSAVLQINVLPVEAVSVPGTPVGNQAPLVNVSEAYTTSGSTCNWGHPVEYSFNWGDGTSSPWSTSTSASHSWSAFGEVTVTVTARCRVHTSVAATSAGLAVNVGPCEMIYIPAGDFLMGNSNLGNDAVYHYSEELPQHPVTLAAYSIGKYEVTRGDYQQFMNAGGYTTRSYWSADGWDWKLSNSRTQPRYWAASQNWGSPPGAFTQTDNHPVVGVSYYEAEAFCNWAGGHPPTEAQWERAARWTGIYAKVYPWGGSWEPQKCNNWLDSPYPGYQTAPVGSYPSGASPSGCQDMAGNVSEWCKDWYLSTYYSQSPTSDPQGPASGSARVLRGGSWWSYASSTRCACRLGYGQYSGNDFNDLGFRFAREAEEAVSVPGTPVGNTSPLVSLSYTYTTTGSTCNWGHPVEYSFDWGDGASSPWSTSTSASHSWSVLGTKTVTVSARCQIHPTVAATSAGLPVNVVIATEMIYIPAGSFDMGTPDSYAAFHYENEHPQHSVSLSGYSIGKYEVTRGEYRAFVNAGGYSTQSYWSTDGWSWKGSRTEPWYWDAVQDWGTGSFTQTDSFPVVGVSYYEAEAFCNWAGGHLATEAQWEKAARWTGSYPNVYPWGDTFDPEKLNNYYDSNSAGGGYTKCQTSPVGSYPSGASPYGCQDMAGNVQEWCKDWFGETYYSQSPTSDPPGPASGSVRVQRGGGWTNYHYDDGYRCAQRYATRPYERSFNEGFRLAR